MASELIGYWGPRTSNIDWCEPNYTRSYYIAEWYNSWSNLPPMIIAAFAMYKGLQRLKATGETVQPLSVAVAYLAPVVVFAGSFAFHSSLTYVGQLLDELPMIYAALIFHISISTHIKRAVQWAIVAGIFITATMLAMRDVALPLQIFYGALVLALVARSFMDLRALANVQNTRILQSAFWIFLSAFVAWLADVHFCSHVGRFYLHAFWHLGTGLGTYLWIQFAMARRFSLDGKKFRVTSLVAGIPFVEGKADEE